MSITMSPPRMISLLGNDGFTGELNRLRAGLADEADEIQELWQGLGRCGGQRADSAAELLARLRPGLQLLVEFAQRCEQQIDAMVADPFGRDE